MLLPIIVKMLIKGVDELGSDDDLTSLVTEEDVEVLEGTDGTECDVVSPIVLEELETQEDKEHPMEDDKNVEEETNRAEGNGAAYRKEQPQQKEETLNSAEKTEEEENAQTVDMALLDLLQFLRNEIQCNEEAFVCMEKAQEETMATMDTVGKPEASLTRLRRLWDKFQKLYQEFKPVMSEDTDVIDIVAEMEKLMYASEMNDGTNEQTLRSLLGHVCRLRDTLCPLDLDKLYQLLSPSQAAGEIMRGKDVFLFLGSTGVGKTTTIQFLAGTTFEEVEVDGYFHLKPMTFPDPKLKEFQTSSGAASATKHVNCFEVEIMDGSVVLCDIPGFGDTEGTEVDIANGFGVIQAIQCARSIKPILVLSKDAMGARGSVVIETVDTITRLLGGKADANTLKAFQYLFTKHEERDRGALYKRFAALRRDTKEKGQLFLSLLEDIAIKASPEANLVLPMQGDASELLSNLSSVPNEYGLDPKESLKAFMSETAKHKLQLQLQYTKSNLEKALSQRCFGIAAILLEQLQRLSGVLPEAIGTFTSSRDTIANFISEWHSKILASLDGFSKAISIETFELELKRLKK